MEKLYWAANSGDVAAVEYILESEPYDINWQNDFGKTPLYIAADCGSEAHLEIVKLLIEHNADVNIPNDRGQTPLYIAAAWGSEAHLEIVKILIEHKADVNIPNDRGHTPLYVAASWGHALVVKYLIQHGAKLDVKMKDGRTPLHIAAISRPHDNPDPISGERYWNYKTDNKFEMYKVAKAYMEEIMKSGQNAEFLPNIENDYKTILSHQHNSDISDSLMDIIVFYNHFATVVELVTAGATLDIKDDKNKNVFDKAGYSGHCPMTSFLEKAFKSKMAEKVDFQVEM